MQCKQLVTWLKDWFYDKTEADNRYQQKSNGLTQIKQDVWSSTNNLTYTLYVDETNRHCTLTITGSSISIASGGANYEKTNWIPSDYRPKGNKFTMLNRSQYFQFYAWSNGTIGISNFASSTKSGQSFGGEIDWNY